MGRPEVSDYQPQNQGGWPQQPPQHPAGQGGDGGQQGAYAPGQQGAYGQQQFPAPGQPGWTPQGYPQLQRGQQSPPPLAQRPGKRRHPLRWLVGTLIVLIAAFVVADQVAKAVAENQFAQKIESSGLNVKPSVSIEEGPTWPFLSQLVSKDLKTVHISTGVIKSGNYEITSVNATATGLHLSSLSSNANAEVDHIDATATISFSSLNNDLGNAIGISGAVTVSADPSAGSDAILVNAGDGLGTVDATIKKTGPLQITIHFGALGGIASLLNGAASIPDQVINIPKLPAGVTIGQPQITSTGIVATASGSHLNLTQ
jgi:hypothetical protein